MALTPNFRKLLYTISKLVPQPNIQILIVDGAGIDTTIFPFYTSTSLGLWFEVFSYSTNANSSAELIDSILERYPKLPEALSIKYELKNNEVEVENLLYDKEWKGKESEYEKVIESQDTFLSINFLELGTKASKAVCKIRVKKNGTDKIEVGTGFLIENDILVTNNHVISSISEAKNAEIIFNYEESPDGNPYEAETYYLNPDVFFKTSRKEELDITLIKLKNSPTLKYGYLKISNAEIGNDKFVNIIQHPSGEYKKIAIYHNIVIYSDSKIVQYLTDTRNGSSGSPVFNSKWEVVAVHHKGGFLERPDLDVPIFANQGINSKNIIKLLEC